MPTLKAIHIAKSLANLPHKPKLVNKYVFASTQKTTEIDKSQQVTCAKIKCRENEKNNIQSPFQVWSYQTGNCFATGI